MNFNHKVVDQMFKSIVPFPEHFGTNAYDIDNPPISYFNKFQDSIWEIDPDARIIFGTTKLVIVSPKVGEDVVIKIPFNGTFGKDGNWVPFRCAPDVSKEQKNNYCCSEYNKYNRLKNTNLNCFAAETTLYECGDLTLYIQELIIPMADAYSEQPQPSTAAHETILKWWDNGTCPIPPNKWIENCLDFYGVYKTLRFVCYCSDIDLDILEDFSTSNAGYRKSDGTPALLDYSNFLECD